MAACFLSWFYTVDNVTAVAQQAVLIDVGRTWLRVLTGNTRKLDHWSGCTIGQHDCHLQQSLDVAANVRFGISLESLRAVTALQQKCFAVGDIGKLVF